MWYGFRGEPSVPQLLMHPLWLMFENVIVRKGFTLSAKDFDLCLMTTPMVVRKGVLQGEDEGFTVGFEGKSLKKGPRKSF